MTVYKPKPQRALLVVRAGDRSLHPNWLGTKFKEDRNWDLHISYFGKNDISEFPKISGVTITSEKGSKYIGLEECLGKINSRVLDYDYIGLPDDDLHFDCDNWNRFFEIIFKYKPSLAQPALHRASFYSHPGLLQQRQFILRWTNFVECMVPVFSREALSLVRPYFTENESGWGMDYLWPRLLKADQLRLCIVDQTPILHTRQVLSGPLYKLLNAKGCSPGIDLQSFSTKYNLEMLPFEVFAAVTRSGEYIHRPSDVSRGLFFSRVRKVVRRRLAIKEIKPSKWFHLT
jgi:hypothetical protein